VIQQCSSIRFCTKVRFSCAIAGSLTLFFLSPFFTNSSLSAAVLINELYPKTEPIANEWVELYNTESDPVSLDRWKLQNSVGTVTTFIPNASVFIAPHGFLTFTGSQTGISFSKEGDTVRLFDEKNNEVDSQWYPGILGYNTAMGRTSDGGGVWALCTIPTYDKPNNCPQPSPTPAPVQSELTSLPANTSTPTTKPLPTRTPTSQPKSDRPLDETPAPVRQTFGALLGSPSQTQVLGAEVAPSPTPLPHASSFTIQIDKIIAMKILLAFIAWSIVADMIYMLYKKRHRRTG